MNGYIASKRTVRLFLGAITIFLPLIMVFSGRLLAYSAELVPFALEEGEITITAGTTQTAAPGATVPYTHTIHNTTAMTLELQIDAVSTQGYTVVKNPATNFTLAPNEQKSIVVSVQVPASVDTNTTDTLNISISSTALPTITASAVDTTNVVPAIISDVFGVEISPSSYNSATVKGGTLTFVHTIKNTGNVEETFDLTHSVAAASNQSLYEVTLNKSSVTLAPNSSETVNVTVRIPTLAITGDSANVTIRAASRRSTTANATAIDIVRTVDPTPTSTATSTATPTRTVTPTPLPTANAPTSTSAPVYADKFEPNNSLETAAEIIPGAAAQSSLTFWPSGDLDYFFFYATKGLVYSVFTKIQTTGLDPYMTLYDPRGKQLATNDDFESFGRDSRIEYLAQETGIYYVQVVNLSAQDSTNRFYSIELDETQPTATPTPSSTPTASVTPSRTPTTAAEGDAYEPNDTFGAAALLEVDTDLSLDFEPAYGTGIDRDYFRFWVKPGIDYSCETKNLQGGNDTSLTLFNQNGDWLGFSDDIRPGNFGSKVDVRSTYTGYIYVLVEPFVAPDLKDAAKYKYQLRCSSTAPTLTPTPATSTPKPTATPSLTPTPYQVKGDDCEPNDTMGGACLISANQSGDYNFIPPYGGATDKDYYRLYIKPGIAYNCETFELSPLNDTRLTLMNERGQVLGFNEDKATGDFSSRVIYLSTFTGFLYVLVEPSVPIPDSNRVDEYRYKFRCGSDVPTETPSPTPTETPTPWPTLTPWPTKTIAPTSTTGPTSTPWPTKTSWPTKTIAPTSTRQSNGGTIQPTTPARQTPDPTVPSGVTLEPNSTSTRPSEPLPTDSPIIIATSTRRPRPVATSTPAPQPTPIPQPTSPPLPTYTPSRPRPIATSTPARPRVTPTPDSLLPTITFPTPLPTATPLPTSTPTPGVSVTRYPTPTPRTTVVAQHSLNVLVYYDENDSFTPEVSEGISDVSVAVYDNVTGVLLAFGSTNDSGTIRLGPYSTNNAVRLSIPYLNYSQVLANTVPSVQVRIAPQPLPGQIP